MRACVREPDGACAAASAKRSRSGGRRSGAMLPSHSLTRPAKHYVAISGCCSPASRLNSEADRWGSKKTEIGR